MSDVLAARDNVPELTLSTTGPGASAADSPLGLRMRLSEQALPGQVLDGRSPRYRLRVGGLRFDRQGIGWCELGVDGRHPLFESSEPADVLKRPPDPPGGFGCFLAGFCRSCVCRRRRLGLRGRR